MSCVIVTGKILMQKLWYLKFEWDKEIDCLLVQEEWGEFINNLPRLTELKIPRYLFKDKPISRIEFHGFADSSIKAYAACVFVRTIYVDNTISVNLIASKSRVAPIKIISLPKLELCAMLLLSQLTKQLISIFEKEFHIHDVHLWTDSEIALCWVQSFPSRWTTFVANRVSKIQELTTDYTWRHISSKLNPADLPSRGVPPQKILSCPLWWHGPHILHEPILDFSVYEIEPNVLDIPEEKKVSMVVLRTPHNKFWDSNFLKFSKFSRLQRTLSYCLRFVNNSRSNKTRLFILDLLQRSVLFHIWKTKCIYR